MAREGGNWFANNWILVVIIALVVYGLNIFPAFTNGINNMFNIGGTQTTPQQSVVTTQIADFCADPSITMTIGPMEKMYSPSTSMSGEYARVFINGKDVGFKADSATMDVSWKDGIDIYYAANSSTYYASHAKFQIPCKSTVNTAELDGGASKLYEIDASTNLNLKVFCEDDGLLNEGTGGSSNVNETIAAGDTVQLEASIQGNYQDAFSPYGDIYVTIKYYSTDYDSFDLRPNTAGWTFTPASTSNFRSSNVSGAGYSTATWKLSPGLRSNEKVFFTIFVDADDTTNPSYDFLMYFDDEDWYQHSVSGAMEFGVATNLDADVGDITDNTKTIYVD